jgi:hypothetical protein
MNLFINTVTQQVVQGIGLLAPANAQTIKSPNTPALNIYFLAGPTVLNLGLSPFIKFAMIAKTGGDPLAPLVQDATFNRTTDQAGNIIYQGFPLFNTTNVQGLLSGGKTSVDCLAEVRYQLPNGEVERTLDIPITIWRPIIPETGAVDPTVIPGYPDASLLVVKTMAGEPFGYVTLDAEGLIPPEQIPLPNLTDFDTALGVSIIHLATGVFNRLLAGTGVSFDTTTRPGYIIINVADSGGGSSPMSLSDAESTDGISLISDAAGILKRLVAGTGISFDTTTPGAIIITAEGGGAGISALENTVSPSGGELSLIANPSLGKLFVIKPGTNVSMVMSEDGNSIIISATGGGSGGVASLTDEETSAGVSIINNASGILNRLVPGTGIALDTSTPGEILVTCTVSDAPGITALSDFEGSDGQSLIHDSSGVLMRIKAGANITFDTTTVPGEILITASGSGLTLSDEETTVGLSLLGATNGQIKRLVAGTGLSLDNTTNPGALTLAPTSPTDTRPLVSLYNNVVGGTGDTAGANWEIGEKITFAVAGTIKGMRFLKVPSEGGTTHNLHLWNWDSGTLVATVATVSETVGWNEVELPTPVDVAAGAIYAISYTVVSHYQNNGTSTDTVGNLSGQGCDSTAGGVNFPNAIGGGGNTDVVFAVGAPPAPGALTLVDEEATTGQTLLGATNGQIKRLIAGANISFDATVTPGAVKISAAGGGLPALIGMVQSFGAWGYTGSAFEAAIDLGTAGNDLLAANIGAQFGFGQQGSMTVARVGTGGNAGKIIMTTAGGTMPISGGAPPDTTPLPPVGCPVFSVPMPTLTGGNTGAAIQAIAASSTAWTDFQAAIAALNFA